MNTADVIVIGAGAAGLMAAYRLTKAGKNVIVLEARHQVGGRIHTITSGGLDIELGAEFVHGDLSVTLELLKEAGIQYEEAGGEMWRFQDGKLIKNAEQTEGWDELMDKLEELKEDTSIEQFLNEYFAGEKYASLRKSVLRFVAGYDSADPGRASAFALREEWQSEDDDAQHRVTGGYGLMIEYLARKIKESGSKIVLNSIAEKIKCSDANVRVTTRSDEEFTAARAIVALPLGVLQANHISFSPETPELQSAFRQLGFGSIIKILFVFKEPFWETAYSADAKKLGFLFSEEKIPTWWTQAPKHLPLLTGWLGGPAAKKLKDTSAAELMEMAVTSLCNIFNLTKAELEARLVDRHIVNWTTDPFTLGSYAYDTVGAHQVRKIFDEPVSGKVYFAGEYLYEGPAMGTVEAALWSGQLIADKAVKNLIE